MTKTQVLEQLQSLQKSLAELTEFVTAPETGEPVRTEDGKAGDVAHRELAGSDAVQTLEPELISVRSLKDWLDIDPTDGFFLFVPFQAKAKSPRSKKGTGDMRIGAFMPWTSIPGAMGREGYRCMVMAGYKLSDEEKARLDGHRPSTTDKGKTRSDEADWDV